MACESNCLLATSQPTGLVEGRVVTRCGLSRMSASEKVSASETAPLAAKAIGTSEG